MSELTNKKVKKFIGLKKSDFNELIWSKEISLRKPRLIPVYKIGDEMALTSVLLSSLRLIKKFRQLVFSDVKLIKGGSIYFYTEIGFKDFPESRIDGLILIVKSGTIRDAAILEVKNGKNELEKTQIERYEKIAKNYSIPKFITISNQFVTDPTQTPVSTKNIRGLDRFHFSWTYLLTVAHVLLFKNDTNIEDEDQLEIMKEVVNYFEWDKSGVFGINQMKAGWVDVVEKVNASAKLKPTDSNVYDAVLSWQQEERDMALALSRELGVFVTTGDTKYKGKLDERLKSDCKSLVTTSQLTSTLKVKGAVSDIKILSLFEKRTVEMIVALKPPTNKTHKGKLGWIKRQLNLCEKKDGELYSGLFKEIYLEVLVKNSRTSERISLTDFDSAYDDLKGKDIREFKIIYLKDFGKRFSSPRKFVDIIEQMLKDYYKGIVQHLTKWEPVAPKMSVKNEEPDDEGFIDEVNNGALPESISVPHSPFQDPAQFKSSVYETEDIDVGNVAVENINVDNEVK